MSERAQIALQVAIVLGVLAAAVYGIVSSAQAVPPPIATLPAGPDASLVAQTVRSPSPTPTATPSPTFATLAPTATPHRVVLQPYAFGGRAYTGVQAGPGTEFLAPFDARVEVVVYQIIDGEFRSGTDLPGQASYPYVFVTVGDRILKLRPGALGTDTEILVRESEVKAGAPLFRVVGTAPSSWHFRYDAAVGAQVIASLETTAGRDLDAAPFIAVR
jgi:hypothetical protein